MRSISVKIILVLVIVSLIGALFTALYIQNRTKNAFDKFIQEQDQQVLTQTLVEYYQTYGSWEGVDQVFKGATLYRGSMMENMKGENHQGPPQERMRGGPPYVLTTATGLILAGGSNHSGYQPGEVLSHKELQESIELESEGESIGLLVVVPFPLPRNTLEQKFLSSLQRGLMISSLATLLIALILGGILIQSFTQPIRKLANATEAVARGDLGYQVEINTQDELGRLAASFNSMSTDLDKADQARKQMTADIAHDLRTPLSVLHGYTEAMNEGKLEGTPEIYQVMHQQAQHLNYLIEDLRTLSLLDSDELSFQIENIDPTLILNQVMAAFQTITKEKELNIHLEISEDLPRADLDPDRLTQVLGNLISNAIKVLTPGGEIKIVAKGIEDALEIQVMDTGPGIEEDHLPHIFDRFYRADKARKTGDGSSGLGLAITKKLVEAQGGSITVESKVGVGTTFRLQFPGIS
jgi:two-component system sensor histidine kinase BaeS